MSKNIEKLFVGIGNINLFLKEMKMPLITFREIQN